jgi:hypothetical protein
MSRQAEIDPLPASAEELAQWQAEHDPNIREVLWLTLRDAHRTGIPLIEVVRIVEEAYNSGY